MSNATTSRIYNQLCPPLPEESDEFAGWRRIIAAAISRYVPELEKLLGLQQPNSQFRHDLSSAILVCVLTNKFPPKRHSETRKELEAICKEAAAAEAIIRRLDSALRETSGIYPPIKHQFLELGKHADDYAALSKLARAHASALSDSGGQRGMFAFRSLVEGLWYAFEKVSGIEASDAAKCRSEKYEGLFFEFVEAVLPLVRELVPEMPCPESRLAQDTSVFKVVTSLRRSGKRQERRKRTRKVARTKRRRQ